MVVLIKMLMKINKETEIFFQFLNFKFYLDDLLILGILFILMSEGLQNQPLFFILLALFFNEAIPI